MISVSIRLKCDVKLIPKTVATFHYLFCCYIMLKKGTPYGEVLYNISDAVVKFLNIFIK